MNNLKKVVRDPGFQEAALATLSNAGAIVKSVAQIAVAEVATGLAGVMAGTPEIPALSKAAIEAASTLQSTLEKQAQLNGDVYSKTGHPKPCQSWWTKNQFWNWIETLARSSTSKPTSPPARSSYDVAIIGIQTL